jgi:hypothetical protein
MATGGGGAPATTLPSAQPAEPLTFTGTTNVNTDLFQLSRDAYRMTWEVTPESDGDCFFDADLRTPDGRRAHSLASPDVAVTRSAETNIYGVRPGAYFLDVSTTCPAWRVTLTAR